MEHLGKRSVFNEETIFRARKIIGRLKYDDPIMASISVILAGKLHLTCKEIGYVFGIAKSTVVRMNKRFRQAGVGSRENKWGGDRRSLLKKEQAESVLSSLADAASAGEIVVVQRVKTELEKALGKKMSLQTAYNILQRHEWRKVRPDKEHPKANEAKQKEFQKKRFRMRYIWLPPKLSQKEKI